jgi:flagellar basal body-associated protein FliL
MPILIIALIALAVFIVMGLMLFSARIAEKRAHQDERGASARPAPKSD